MAARGTTSFQVTRVGASASEVFDDIIAIEEPLEIIVAWNAGSEPREKTISVMMRTPGDDFDLAIGFLFTEGLIRSADDVTSLRHWASPNRVRAALRPELRLDTSRLDRHFYTTSSCGVCGKTSIDALGPSTSPLPSHPPVARDLIAVAARSLYESQAAFRETGGVHGAAIVDGSSAVQSVREDVGRHNAVDKAIGSMLREGRRPLNGAMLVVSSRAGFEIVQKAVVAGIPALISIGAPSSLAIDMARQFNLTLVGFVRDDRFNVYAGEVV